MTPKELLLATLKCKPTPRPAWIPFAGAYASRLKGYTATEMFQSADKLTECLLEVNRMFKPDGVARKTWTRRTCSSWTSTPEWRSTM